MPLDAEVVEAGRLMTDRGRTVLLRDDGGTWGLFLEADARAFFGQRVTVRGNRFGFAVIHVTGIAAGSTVPPVTRTSWLSVLVVGGLCATGGLGLAWTLGSLAWRAIVGLLT